MNRIILSLVSGKPTYISTLANSVSFLSVKVGASELEIKEATGHFDFSAKNLTNVGLVDGRSVSGLGSTLDAHLNGKPNKHMAAEIAYGRIDGSKKNVQATSDDVEAALTDLDDVIGILSSLTPVNYTAGAANLVGHLSGVDTALGTKLPKAGGAMSGNIDMALNSVINLPSNPIAAHAAVSKAYVDAVGVGARMKGNVAVATTANINVASAPAAIDGYTLVLGDRILVKNQTAATENGVYDFNGAGSALTRSADTDNTPLAEILNGVLIPKIIHGTANVGKTYVLYSVGTGAGGMHVIGTDSILFQEFATQSTLTQGDGIFFNGLIVNVKVADLVGWGIEDDGANNFKVKAGDATVVVDAAGVKVGVVQTANLAAASVTKAKIAADVAGAGLRQAGDGSIERDDAKSLINDNASAITVRQVVKMKVNGHVNIAQATDANVYDDTLGIVEDTSIASGLAGKVIVRPGAIIPGFTGLTPNAMYYLSPTVAGGMTTVFPSTPGQTAYELGKAISANEFLFNPRPVAVIA